MSNSEVNNARDWATWCPLPGHDGTHRHGHISCVLDAMSGVEQ